MFRFKLYVPDMWKERPSLFCEVPFTFVLIDLGHAAFISNSCQGYLV